MSHSEPEEKNHPSNNGENSAPERIFYAGGRAIQKMRIFRKFVAACIARERDAQRRSDERVEQSPELEGLRPDCPCEWCKMLADFQSSDPHRKMLAEAIDSVNSTVVNTGNLRASWDWSVLRTPPIYWRVDPALETQEIQSEPPAKPKVKPRKLEVCSSCRFWFGAKNICCAVHPYGQSEDVCRDWEGYA